MSCTTIVLKGARKSVTNRPKSLEYVSGEHWTGLAVPQEESGAPTGRGASKTCQGFRIAPTFPQLCPHTQSESQILLSLCSAGVTH